MQNAVIVKTAFGTIDGQALLYNAIICVALGVVGYMLSQRIRATRGVTPWKIPSIAWAVICFAIPPIGFLVELLAVVMTRPVGNGASTTPPAYTPSDTLPARVQDTPTPATVPTTSDVIAAYVPKTPPSGYGGPASDVLGKPALFGWYKDVTGRHEMRYWDGRDWTKYVGDASVTSEDPLTH